MVVKIIFEIFLVRNTGELRQRQWGPGVGIWRLVLLRSISELSMLLYLNCGSMYSYMPGGHLSMVNLKSCTDASHPRLTQYANTNMASGLIDIQCGGGLMA